MHVLFTVKAETPQEWNNYKESIWFYLEDVPINRKDFTIQHNDVGFKVMLHEWDAARARLALKDFCTTHPVTMITEMLADNPEIVPVKKKKPAKKKADKVSNIRIKSRDNVAIRKTK